MVKFLAKNIDRKGKKKKLPMVTEGLQELRVDPWPSKVLDAVRIVEFGWLLPAPKLQCKQKMKISFLKHN